MGDDGIRELHGVAKRDTGEPLITVGEVGNTVRVAVGYAGTNLRPQSARHLARSLYRLARRIEQREPASKSEPLP